MFEFELKGISTLILGASADKKTSSHIRTEIELEIDTKLDKDFYFDKDSFPTKVGVKSLTQCFIQGIVGNIHSAHQKGQWDSAEHLRYVISELERGFAQVATVDATQKEK
jgi:hypothetical protein